RSAAGEVLLADAVAAIDRAEGGGRSTLVEAHRLYRQARKDYANDRAGAAEVQLRRAATLFAQSGSPMAEVAAYYAANATLDQNRGVQAHDELTRLLARIDATRYRAFAAQIHWTLAVDANSRGDWGTGAREADAA